MERMNSAIDCCTQELHTLLQRWWCREKGKDEGEERGGNCRVPTGRHIIKESYRMDALDLDGFAFSSQFLFIEIH